MGGAVSAFSLVTGLSTAKAMSDIRLLCINLDWRTHHEAHGIVSVADNKRG